MSGEAVLLSIKPKYCELIANGKKTIEVRKSRPATETPFKCYIYCTGGDCLWKNRSRVFLDRAYNRLIDEVPDKLNGKIIGEFVCNRIAPIAYTLDGLADVVDCDTACMKPSEFIAYGKGNTLYGWCISELVIYDKPKSLGEFQIAKPPQSWRYVEERDRND